MILFIQDGHAVHKRMRGWPSSLVLVVHSSEAMFNDPLHPRWSRCTQANEGLAFFSGLGGALQQSHVRWPSSSKMVDRRMYMAKSYYTSHIFPLLVLLRFIFNWFPVDFTHVSTVSQLICFQFMYTYHLPVKLMWVNLTRTGMPFRLLNKK